ncbi:hypothetical protein M569_08957 [Genlisea aurea]|uniref:40S ribosomal protein S27 n=4 Tax=Pentapetalae TaxID=1437201 RepID=S8E0G1_9LAMI|nr:hypothetical protein M569_08957 [Genlisea aurea]
MRERLVWTAREDEPLIAAFYTIIPTWKCDNWFWTGFLLQLEKEMQISCPSSLQRSRSAANHVTGRIGSLALVHGANRFHRSEHRKSLSSLVRESTMVLPNDIDLLNPPAELEKRKHKLKRLVQSPNSFFMDVKCQGCFNITTVFSHSQTVVVCGNCQTVLCQPTGGRARLTEGCSFRRKGD